VSGPASEPESPGTAEAVSPARPSTEIVPSAATTLPPEVLAQVKAEFYEGLIPHPDILRGYEDLVPGAAKKILDTFDNQSHHRMAIERKVVDSDVNRSWAGLAAGTVVCLAVLVVAVVAFLVGQPLAGTFLGTLDLVGLAGAFINAGRERRAEREQKANVMTPPPSRRERKGDVNAELRRRGPTA
jgi:uncharacterized membrane protein